MSVEAKIVAPAADRNKEPILSVLSDVLREKFGEGATLTAVELAAGTGQHVAHFARQLGSVTWHPSDMDQKYVDSIKAYVEEEKLDNVKEPMLVDVTKPVDEWGLGVEQGSVDVLLNINMIHISPWACTEGLFVAAAALLRPKGIMVTYGPYAIHGKIEPKSNVAFNASLKSQNKSWGLRDVADLEKEAKKNGLTFDAMFNMPANNKTLVWQKNDPTE